MIRRGANAGVTFAAVFAIGCTEPKSVPDPATVVDAMPVNHLQIIGSHNSYRLRTYEPLFNFVREVGGGPTAQFDVDAWDYTHLPLETQLDEYKVRSLEIDLYRDPSGGRFYDRMGNALVGEPTASGIPALLEPGAKVLHVVDFDYMTHTPTFKLALNAIRAWSRAHPTHFPLFILLELKDDSIAAQAPGLGFTVTLRWDADAVTALEEEIAAAFAGDTGKLFTPDELRGDARTLPDAIRTRGWPTVGQMRGRVVFIVMMNGEARAQFSAGEPVLAGRLLFPFSNAGALDAAFLNFDNPVTDFDEIERQVRAGYIVRTRADEETREARTGDTARRDKAFASGAQIVSTDYYRPDPRAGSPGWTHYSVRFQREQAAARLHPYLAPGALSGNEVTEREGQIVTDNGGSP